MELKIIFMSLIFLIKLTLADEVTELSTSSKPSACNNALRKKFEEWKAKFKVTYQTIEEEENRREIFCSNSKKVQNHNGSGNATYTRAENKHSDKTSEERNDNMLGAKKPAENKKVENRMKTSSTVPPKTQKTKRTKTTKAKKTKSTKNTVKNKMTTSSSTVRVTTRPQSTIKNQAVTVTTKKTTFPWTTKSPPSTRSVSLTRSVSSTTRSTSTSTGMPTTTEKLVMKPEVIEYTVNSGPIPDYLNYTSDCTPAKDQYGCGACWVRLII